MVEGGCTFVLLDPVPGLEHAEVRGGVPQRQGRAREEHRHLLTLPHWDPLVVRQLRQAGESVQYGLQDRKQNKTILVDVTDTASES